jgi:hypothetical protein
VLADGGFDVGGGRRGGQEREEGVVLGDGGVGAARRVAEGRAAQAREPQPAHGDEVLELRVRAGIGQGAVERLVEPGEPDGVEVGQALPEPVVDRAGLGEVAAARCGWASATAAPSTIARVWQASR